VRSEWFEGVVRSLVWGWVEVPPWFEGVVSWFEVV
jgi:hypothetical protein